MIFLRVFAEGSSDGVAHHASTFRDGSATARQRSNLSTAVLRRSAVCADAESSTAAGPGGTDGLLPAPAAAATSASELSEFPELLGSAAAAANDVTTASRSGTTEEEAAAARRVHLHADRAGGAQNAVHRRRRQSGELCDVKESKERSLTGFFHPQQTKRKLEDVSKRLELLYDLLREKRVS